MSNLNDFEACWSEYKTLMKTRPELFVDSTEIAIVTDKDIAINFYKESGKKLGVVYKSQYNQLIVDLIKANDGTLYTYERFEPVCNNGGVVSVAIKKDKFILLKQFRHALRDYEYSFPRGYGEEGLSSEDNVIKEIIEEISCDTPSVQYLGTIVSNSGISGSKVDAFLCNISNYDSNSKVEGITEVLEVSAYELENMVAENKITDCFTISAYFLYRAKFQ